jgi:hypothetical protein
MTPLRLVSASRHVVAATCALMAIASGCKKDPAPPESGAPSAPVGPGVSSTALRIAGPTETPVLTGLPVLAMLPTTTAAVGAIDGLIPMFTRLG